MMNKGSGPVYYERRGGEWVEKNPSKVKTVNDVLGIPPSPYGCSHEWGGYNGPIPSFATTLPMYYYTCKKCKTTHQSYVKLPLRSACEHDYTNDSKLGPAYAIYESCTKCGDQRIKALAL